MKKRNFATAILLLTTVALSGCNKAQAADPTENEVVEQTTAVVSEPETAVVETDQPSEETNEAGQPDLLDVFSDEKLESLFGGYKNASFIISDGERTLIYNDELAHTGKSPFSTFKIPNTLIGLETGAITLDDNFKKWDGTIYTREVQNQDHDLASAMENSIVWYYKELANDIGEENMKEYLKKMDYGNQDISGGLDEFWLGSSMKITPLEQLEFIKKFYHNEFGFSEANVNYVKSIIKQKDLNYDIYGKSGSSGEGMSWFIGYVMQNDKPYFFVSFLEDRPNGVHAKAEAINMFTDILN